MRKWLNIYFSFSKREYNGLLVLIFLLAVITALPSVYTFLVPEQDDLAAEQAAIKKLTLVEAEIKAAARYKYKGRVKAADIKPFKFDPNHTGLAGWQLLGLSAKQAAVMIRYTAKGGKFRKKEDLKKMYTISPEMYQRLSPYITIDTSAFVHINKYVPAAPRKAVVVQLNTADTLELDKIKGIGPAFARRIFKYRERLGGFYKKEQLMEVFGLDSAKFHEISDQISIDATAIKQISINRAEYAGFKNHPYLNPKEVNAIIQFRKQHGNYVNIADLKKVAILSAGTIEKLAPYISFDHD